MRPGTRSAAPFRIMVVDDSAVIRGLLTRSLEADPDLAVVASVGDGQQALNAVQRHDIEIVILDIEMPVMDGLTALPKLIALKPGLPVLIASTLTRRGAMVSLKALSLGAADYVTKPGSSALTTAEEFKRELVGKVKGLAQARRQSRGETMPSAARRTGEAAPAPALPPVIRPGEIRLRPMPVERPDVVAIGSSTGGPQALFRLLKSFVGIKQPVLITQHMPATFTTILAEHIVRLTGLAAAEAVDREPVVASRVYIAPGDYHMIVETHGANERRLRLSKGPPENFCRPSVDPMLRSLAQVYGRRVLCAILTGMGSDGLKGGQALVAAGAAVVAQDEKTSIVWGMPGAVATAGLCSAVLPIDELGSLILRIVGRTA
ncbi:MAG TPA: chemotaxis response regulator protein-glutamate methylesterase [Stellaceae bacterium]|nr:chemotaxis response regulator protein-glutamate methylesterase [Stellaceae bacterium]